MFTFTRILNDILLTVLIIVWAGFYFTFLKFFYFFILSFYNQTGCTNGRKISFTVSIKLTTFLHSGFGVLVCGFVGAPSLKY